MKMRLHVLILAALGFCANASWSSAATYYVKAGASGSGTSWANAMGNLQAAIEACAGSGGGAVWVAAGTYKPTMWPNGGGGSRAVHFSLRNNVTVYGGFPATGSPTMGQRDPVVYPTICSGAIGDPADFDNVYHLFYHPEAAALDGTAVLDGVRIEHGNADSFPTHYQGGGMYNQECSPTIRNSVFSGCQAIAGGALYGFRASPRVMDCVFCENSSREEGGALWSQNSSPVISGTLFSNNTAGVSGGAAYSMSSQPSFSNCTFVLNRTSSGPNNSGSALYNNGGSATVMACLFDRNAADDHGAVAEIFSSSSFYSGCTFRDNSGHFGGAVHCRNAGGVTFSECLLQGNFGAYGGALFTENSQLNVISCVLDGNAGNWGGGGIWCTDGSSMLVANSIISGNHANGYGGGARIDYADCTIVNSVVYNNTAEDGGGVSFKGSRQSYFYNSIIRGNHADHSEHDNFYFFDDAREPGVAFCNVTYDDGVYPGSGNIGGDILFMDADDPAGEDDTWMTADDGYRLRSDSPCREAGTVEALPADLTDVDGDGDTAEDLPLDLIHHLRVQGARVDMGAYEFGSAVQPSYSVDFVIGARGMRAGGGALHQDVVVGHAAEAPTVIGVDGWVFTGWDADFSRITGDLTVNAQYSLSAHEVHFDLGAHAFRVGGGNLIQNVSHGAAAAAPLIRMGVGWYFLGWDAAFDHVTGDLVVHALCQSISAPAGIVYVKAGATGNGSSWAQAMGDLQAAIDYAGLELGDGQVWVARGTYYPNSWPWGGWTERTKHFTVWDNVRVYGGFPAAGSPGMGDRDWIAHPTICSGDLGAPMDYADNVFHVFKIRHAENAVLDGLVIEWGNANAWESPDNAGGGLYCDYSSPAIVRCAFGDNRARNGGGAYCKYGVSPTFTECRFSDNTATLKGGGMRNYAGARPILDACVFHSNEAEYGGGMANDLAYPDIKRCRFEQNTATDWGGAMHNAGGYVRMYNGLLRENTAGDGGAVFNSDGIFWAFNTLWHGNVASFSGGALYNELDASSYLFNSTVTGNGAGSGGGTFSWNAGQHVYNSILWNNSGGSFVNIGSTPSVRYSIIQGGYAGGIGVLDQDPLFANAADPNGADNEWLTADDGLRLQAASIALNYGSDSYVIADYMDLDGDADTEEAIPLDIIEGARTVGLHVDLGAYEYPDLVTHTVTFNLGVHGHRTGGGALVQEVERHGAATAPTFTTDIGWLFTGWDRTFSDVTGDLTVNAAYEFVFETGDTGYVRQGATGNGTSWAEAAGDLQGVIEAIRSAGGGQVWVAAGAYKPNSFPNGGSGSRQQHFSLRNAVTVFGGFPAEGDPGLADRDPDSQLTICTGDIGVSDEASDNTYHVFYHPASAALAASAVLDGFVIHGGHASGSAPHDSGGGMYNSSCSPTLRACVFLANYATRGGGMYNLSSSPKLTHCRFLYNNATDGGGMRNYTASSPSLASCVFQGNAATDGGAMYNHSASPLLVNSVFCGNTASDQGAGLYNSSAAAMVYCSTFHDNDAAAQGGGIYNTSSSPTIENCILWGNTAPAGSNLYDGASSSSMVGNSTVGGGWAAGYNISGADPLFQNPSDPDGADNRIGTSDDGLRLDLWSPALNAGGNGSLPADSHDLDGDGNTAEILPIDLAGKARVVDGTVDPGAYEYETPVHTVTFDLGAHGTRTGGGALVQRVADGASASAPTLDTELGWAFTGWDRAFAHVTGDLLVTAQYEFITFDVTFDLGEHGARVGGGALAQVVPYGGAATAPMLTVADHWYFTGWSVAFDEVTSDLDVAAVYAHIQANDGICRVKQGATGSGASWADAMGDLQAAINEIRLLGTGQVWVAAGTYRPNSWPSGGTGDFRAMHFALANGVAVYGGFPAAGNPGMADRAPAAYPSLCSGDIGAAGVSTDNVHHVFHHGFESALAPSAVLDGFGIRHGQATGAFPNDSGGGMLNRASSPTIRNCVFADNAGSWGGGMQNMNSSSPLLEDCSFINNQAFWGGAMGNQGGSYPTIYDSTFRSNRASRGAAVYSFEAPFQAIADCVFERNQATENGGALYLDGACGIVSRSAIRGNHALNGGGAVLAGNTRLFCSLVTSNSSTMSGAGVYLSTTGRIEYCTIAANVSGKHGGGLCMEGHGAVLASIIHGNTAAADGPNCHDASSLGAYDHCCTTPEVAGAGLVTDPPAFAAPAAGNFRLAAGSPCVDAGPAGAEAATDLDGLPRPLDGNADGENAIDIGAYEFLNEDADSDADEMRDGWEFDHDMDPLDPSDAAENPDKDPFTNRDEAIADTDPFDPGSYLRITQILFMPEPTLFYWPASHRRVYTVCTSTNLRSNAWTDEPTATRIRPPASGVHSIHLWGREEESDGECYRIRASYP